jgi:hypothetical protein
MKPEVKAALKVLMAGTLKSCQEKQKLTDIRIGEIYHTYVEWLDWIERKESDEYFQYRDSICSILDGLQYGNWPEKGRKL